MNLDPRTVGILVILGASLMGGGLLAATRGYLGDVAGGSRWAKATFLQALGWVVFGVLRGVVPDLASVVIGNGLLLLSLGVYLSVLAEFSGRTTRTSWVYALVALQSFLLAYFLVASPNVAARIVVTSVCSATLLLRSSQVLLSGPAIRPPSHLFTAGLSAVCGSLLLVRAVYYLVWNPNPDLALFAPGLMNDISYFTIYVTATVIPFGFVLMLSDRHNLRQKLAEASLQESLRGKEALLQEVHHRVKNNLQLITSLMRLEAGRRQGPEARAVLQEMQGRMRSVILLNEALYRTESYSRVNLADYLRQVATHLFAAQNANTSAVRLALDLGPVEVLTGQAIPCGLIVNELVTNSLKHAFAGARSGEVRIVLQQEAGGSVRLQVSDTGVDLPIDFEKKRGLSLGLQLVSDLARQLQGTLEVGPNATFTVVFVPRFAMGEVARPK